MSGTDSGLSPRTRLFRRLEVDETTGCWNWTGHVAGGYGRIRVGGETVQSHRLSYELHRGLIPSGLQLDHLCRNQRCANPEHLEPVTPRENSLRGVSPIAEQARQTVCKRGHLLAGENLRLRGARETAI